MHIYFSGIGGAGIGPLALIAKQAGFEVSGSDKQDSQYITYLKEHGVTDISIGQTRHTIEAAHATHPIDWFVYSSALPKENPEHPELMFAHDLRIRHSKRDEFLTFLLAEKKQKVVAIAGTHGKSTTTAMAIWAFKQLGIPVSYSVGAKLSFGDMGEFNPKSEYFIYECDEYDRNFLAFHPHTSIITGVAWDHHDIYPTSEEYDAAFRQFLNQSTNCVMWKADINHLGITPSPALAVLDEHDPAIDGVKLVGAVNRRNAWQVIHTVGALTNTPREKLQTIMHAFPGLSRRFEQIAPGLYTDYAHTAEKIAGALEVATETNPHVVVVYEGLHNRRQHFMLRRGQFTNLFAGVKHLYWVPSYLAREDPSEALLTPAELIEKTGYSSLAEPAELNDQLKKAIDRHLAEGDLVLCITAGGGGSLDEWLRRSYL